MATSRFLRFFSRRQVKTLDLTIPTGHQHFDHSDEKFFPDLRLTNGKIHSIEKEQPSIKQGLVCAVFFLDGEQVNFEVDRKALGKHLYDKVVAYLKLIEVDYFALQFTDNHNVKQWLDPTKSIKKQCQIGPPYTFRFRVKFYSTDPQNLHEELTRYLFVLQLKDDIRTGKLDCPLDSAIDLAALAMQAELGDCTSQEHSVETISEFRFLPNESQTEEFEEQVFKKWISYKGLTPADCEIQYLNRARWLEMYGVDLHTVMGKDGLEYKLGLTPTGILVFENNVKIGLFVWPKVTRIDFHRSKLTIIVVEDDDHDPKVQRDFVFVFRCYDEKECKHFWKCALEHHIFYRVTSAKKAKQASKSSFTRTGSRFRFSGRTEFQTAAFAAATMQLNSNFERKASQRFSRRASYAIRKKIQDQEILREQEEERMKKLKLEQEAKLAVQRTSNGKLSSSQKNLSLSATQRLDNLIQETPIGNPESSTAPSAPPVPPRSTKPEEKPVQLASIDNEGHDQTSLIVNSPDKTSNGSSQSKKTNSSHQRYTLATPTQPQLVKSSPSSSSASISKQSFFTRFPLFASPIPELTSIEDQRASYDNIMNYCLNPSKDQQTIYAQFDFKSPLDVQYQERCANYDNLSYLLTESRSARKDRKTGVKIASCKDYFAAATGLRSEETRKGDLVLQRHNSN